MQGADVLFRSTIPAISRQSRTGYEATAEDARRPYTAVHPPSTTRLCPVTYAAASDARNTTAPAMS